ncbi:hypothetical protein VARIO8X_50575 [Burkholderiales bacterium 8X]|nr:hypothetical protein VARIO8X_50575 [Burkholderiales bacterium 8X]
MKNDKERAVCALEEGCCASRDCLRRVVGGLLMVSLIAAPVHGVAQIAALPSAAAMHRPQVLMTPNGVPMVNITAPSAAGVSRNLYQQFDVDRKGAILNNSRTGAQTNLGGAVGANPWLANGAARVILNEVRSNDPSLLRGPVEVAGQRAEVVIANPSGIQVDGGAFINASRATLTTGTPEVNALGGLERYVVRDGTITVDGAGLDLSRTDYGAILARAIKVNSAIWANYLQATGGANEIDAATGEAKPVEGRGERPQFRLDVALLGGMYAGKIFLNGTEHGLGVRNFGTLSSTGDLILTSDGKLVNKGTIEAASVKIKSADGIDNQGGTIRHLQRRRPLHRRSAGCESLCDWPGHLFGQPERPHRGPRQHRALHGPHHQQRRPHGAGARQERAGRGAPHHHPARRPGAPLRPIRPRPQQPHLGQARRHGAARLDGRRPGGGPGWRRCNADQLGKPSWQQCGHQQLHGSRGRIADAQPGQSMPDHLHTRPVGRTRRPLPQGHNHHQGPSRLHGQQQRAMHIHQKRLQRSRLELPANR